MIFSRSLRCLFAGAYIILLILNPGRCLAETSFMLLVSPDWLNNNLTHRNLLIVDTRDPESYALAHIPGAINIPVEKTFAISDTTYRVGGLHQIKELFSQHGINRTDHIVVYDDGKLIDAARLFWVLEVYGHQRVSLMDGGISHWVNNGLPTEMEKNLRKPTDYIPTIDHQRFTSKMAMQLALSNPAVSIIDARTQNEYAGSESIADRAGHIPGAINIPWTNNMKQAGGLINLLGNSELTQHYHDHKDKRIITYCNRGKQSALTYFTLRHLGYDVSVYDGAWLEWANDQSLPIE